MPPELRETIGWITIALLIGSMVFFAPMRGRRTLVATGTVRAPPEVVWQLLREPLHAAFSAVQHETDPAVTILSIQSSWTEQRVIKMKLRTLAKEPPLRLVQRLDEIDGKILPHGADGLFTEQLEHVPGGTRIVLCFDGELGSSLEAVFIRWDQRAALARVARTLQRQPSRQSTSSS